MTLTLALAPLLAAALGASEPQVAWNETTLMVPGRVLSADVVRLADDGPQEIALAVWNRDLRRRELRLHPVGERRVASEPRLVLPILEDIVAWGVAELDADAPGRELLLLTPSSAWSYRVAPGGYASNARQLFEHPLLYDMPDRGTLPRWEYVIPAPAGDLLLLPSPTGYSVWAPRPGAGDGESATWVESARFSADGEVERDAVGGASVRAADDEIVLSASARAGLDTGEELDGLLAPPLLSVQRSQRAPALVDMDADGRPDVVRLESRALHVHLARTDGVPAVADLQSPLPEAIYEDAESREFELRDLDADGDADLLAIVEGDEVGILDRNRHLLVFVLVNDGSGHIPARIRQLLKFQGVRLHADVVDVDGDGTPDLVLDVFVAPDLTGIASPDQLEARLRVLAYRGTGDGTFERRPMLTFEHRVDAGSVDEAARHRELTGDLTGDGLPDLVTADLLGRVGIRPLERSSGLFGGGGWKLPATPVTRLSTTTGQRELLVRDLDDDALADLVSVHADRVVVFLSQRTGGPR